MEMFRPRAGRPLGITIIAVLMLITALFGVCGGLATLAGSPLGLFDGGIIGVFSTATGAIFGIILAIANIVLAFGLLSTARWAYIATIIIEALTLLNIVGGGIGVPRFACGAGIIPIIVIIYMVVDGNVRRAFEIST